MLMVVVESYVGLVNLTWSCRHWWDKRGGKDRCESSGKLKSMRHLARISRTSQAKSQAYGQALGYSASGATRHVVVASGFDVTSSDQAQDPLLSDASQTRRKVQV